MTLEEYTNRKWIVINNEIDAECKEGDIVIFDGLVEKVNIRCAVKRYGDGQFEGPQMGEEDGTIKVGDHVIRMSVGTNGKRQITFGNSDQQAFAGSWTAEDYVPGSKPEPAGG